MCPGTGGQFMRFILSALHFSFRHYGLFLVGLLVLGTFISFPPAAEAATPSIAAGAYHTCALNSAGGVQCWGYNFAGQLGNGTTTQSDLPVPVVGLSDSVVSISGGYIHTCAVTSAGAAQCWGYNTDGELGIGTINYSPTPVTVNGLGSGVIAIAAGYHHTCAVTDAGAVLCWGDNTYGQLGNNSTTSSLVPVPVSGLTSGVIAVSAGYYHTCALTNAGAMFCWGYNNLGQLGNGTTTSSLTPVPVSGLSSGVVSIGTGSYHTCASTSAGAALCWGNNASGQLGNGTSTQSHSPSPVSNLSSGVASVAIGYFHSCALLTGGAMKCWGSGLDGELGNGVTGTSNTPVSVIGLTNAMAASLGYSHTCAVSDTGAVQCWGYNYYGQLGNGASSQSNTPVSVYGMSSGIAAIATGDNHTCSLTTSGAVQCWGNNSDGQLGNGTITHSATPVPVSGLNSGVAAISGGANHTCALTSAGAVRCWGKNNYGQVGNGTTSQQTVPVSVSGLSSGVTAIGTGVSHSCALTSAGGVQCWGYNTNGQLGNGTTTSSSTPVPVSGLSSGVLAIAVGGNHSCAFINTGAVLCWGYNGYGQLGNGTTTQSTTPVPVTGLSTGVVRIAAGYGHTCALNNVGVMQCWGWNGYGQLGNNTTTSSVTPVTVTGLASGVSAISAGYAHTCAMTSGGTVQCWGYNYFGQLATGDAYSSSIPVTVSGLSGVVAIATGHDHTCVLTSTGGVQCWGSEYYGQLGNGIFGFSSVPATVLDGSGQGSLNLLSPITPEPPYIDTDVPFLPVWQLLLLATALLGIGARAQGVYRQR